MLFLLILPGIVSAEPLRVFVSVLPIQTLVERVGGEHVDVRAMVRPGYDPHHYHPTPLQITELAEAVLYVRTGVDFERAWMERILSANADMQVLDLRDGLETRRLDDHSHDHAETHPHDDHDSGHEADAHAEEHADSESDPHLWTSPPLVIKMVGAIRDKLSGLDSANREAYRRNHDLFVEELESLDRELHALLDPLTQRRFMVYHPAWGYFADTYDLEQVPIEHEGKQPGAKALAGLINQAKQEDIRVVFVQPQFDKRHAEQVAGAIGGKVVMADPLAADYTENLRRVARQMSESMTR